MIFNQKTGVCLVNQYTYDIWNWHCIKENGYDLKQQEKILKCVYRVLNKLNTRKR